MLKKLLPHNKKSLFWFAALPFIAGLTLFAKHTHTHTDNGHDEDVYIFKTKDGPKAVFVTNSSPKKAVKSAAKNYINSNFKG